MLTVFEFYRRSSSENEADIVIYSYRLVSRDASGGGGGDRFAGLFGDRFSGYRENRRHRRA
jgi:hypothetical protein